MSGELITYNGYQFDEYSHVTINAQLQDDDAQRTTLYHRYRIHVETTIYAQDGDNAGQAGSHFARIRDRLTKKGQALVIWHLGFDGAPFDVNVATGGRKDVTFGPHPRLVTWDPVGEANAVHVIWECEFCLSACGRWTGIMAINYSVNTRIDSAGYTTRTINGYIEIAMTRVGQRFIPDTADAYRDTILIAQLPNFQREHTWNLSADKRRADFTIVDTQIRSPNEFAPGVINISGNHLVQWSRRQAASLPQTIRVTIELAQGQPRSRAWEIFKAILDSRLAFSVGTTVFFDSLYADESLFSNTISFSINYHNFVKVDDSILTALSGLFTSTGFTAPLRLGTWQQWKQQVLELQSHRGQSKLRHLAVQDQIVDLCAVEFFPGSLGGQPDYPYTPNPLPPKKLYNVKPKPRDSYLRYETWMELKEDTPTSIQVGVDPEDLEYDVLNPDDATGSAGSVDTGVGVKRFLETQAGTYEVIWQGYAERVGYQIPRPDKIEIGGIRMTRIGESRFRQKFLGNILGQPVYAASWNQRYAITEHPETINSSDLNDWEVFP